MSPNPAVERDASPIGSAPLTSTLGSRSMKAFISYSSGDKRFVNALVRRLRIHRVDVWFDELEIGIGDSIVEKVFDGLEASDALIVILSKNSVASRWVREELNAAMIRRIDDNKIILMPILMEQCEIPSPLKHIKYADFTRDSDGEFEKILDRLEPLHALWQSLSQYYEHSVLIADKIRHRNMEDDIRQEAEHLHELINAAVDARCLIEKRLSREQEEYHDFFQKVDHLATKGVDIRSHTLNALVAFRSIIAHRCGSAFFPLREFAAMFKARYQHEDARENLDNALRRIESIMKDICSGNIDLRAM